MFLATNLNNVKTDAARGHGEYLESLGHLLEVQAADQIQFVSTLREQYSLIADHDRAVVGHVAAAVAQQVRQSLQADPSEVRVPFNTR